MSKRKAVANSESTQVIGIIDKTTTIIPTTWEDADRMRACHRSTSSILAGHQCVAADRVLSETVSLALLGFGGVIHGPTVT